jgi:hypothetical protein
MVVMGEKEGCNEEGGGVVTGVPVTAPTGAAAKEEVPKRRGE